MCLHVDQRDGIILSESIIRYARQVTNLRSKQTLVPLSDVLEGFFQMTVFSLRGAIKWQTFGTYKVKHHPFAPRRISGRLVNQIDNSIVRNYRASRAKVLIFC